MTDSRKTLIPGIGNVLLQDKGAGIHAIRLLADLAAQRAPIGIQPQTIAWGETPTPQVAIAIQQASNQALQLVEEWNT